MVAPTRASTTIRSGCRGGGGETHVPVTTTSAGADAASVSRSRAASIGSGTDPAPDGGTRYTATPVRPRSGSIVGVIQRSGAAGARTGIAR
jgi:hypothetical protein